MKIDWSKWFFESRWKDNDLVFISNPSENITLWERIKIEENLIDNPDEWIKEWCKNKIRGYVIGRRLTELHDQTIPVEDNLDYIENEAKRRGLDV